MNRTAGHMLAAFSPFLLSLVGTGECRGAAQQTEANVPTEIALRAIKPHPEPFREVVLDVVFTDPQGAQKTVPAFWAGQNLWKVRYASPVTGMHRYRSTCKTQDDPGLHGIGGQLEVKPYAGDSPLYRHGPIRAAADHRHFAHADGTPFFWLGDTWWKCLCKRMTWEGFQELTADRKAKGFTVVQIVCGPYPASGMDGGGLFRRRNPGRSAHCLHAQAQHLQLDRSAGPEPGTGRRLARLLL